MPELHPSPADAAALNLALAVADRTPVDWAELSSSISHDDVRHDVSHDESSGSLELALQRVERIIEGHRALYAQRPEPAVDTLLTEARRAAEPASRDDRRVSWGPLIVREKVGHGSFGDVYRAWDPSLEREVALKLVPETTTTQSVSHAFEEGRLLARVRHPNVVTVYGVERVEGRVGIWMEFVPGRTLAEEVNQQGPLAPDEAARIGIEVCRALGAVHEAGLLHRDVKAQNVMRDEGGRVLLGDFGTSVRSAEDAPAEPVVAGTPLYLSPEVCRGEPPAVSSDLYSVGVLLYFLVTGKHPVNGRTFAEVRDAHAAGRLTLLREALPELPNEFVQIVDTLLERSPERRHPTAGNVEASLNGWLQGQVLERARVAGLPRPLKEALARSRWVTATVVTSLAGAGLLGWFTYSSSQLATGAPPPLGAGIGLSAPMTRQVVDPPCFGPPSLDGQWIACIETRLDLLVPGEPAPQRLVLFGLVTGELKVLVQPPEDARIQSAVLSPAGDRVVYMMWPGDAPTPEIRRYRIADGYDRLIGHLPPGGTDLRLNQWLESDGMLDGRLLRDDDSQAFVLLSPDTGVVQTVFEFMNPPQGFSRSPDGRFLAFDVRESNDRAERDIQVCELASGTCAVLAHPAHDFFPLWAPDGRLFFDSDRGGTIGLWAVELDGLREAASPVQLQDAGHNIVVPFGFTRSGAFFHSLRRKSYDIYSVELVPQAGSPPGLIPISKRAADVNKSAVWSADGRWLAYVSQRGPFVERGAVYVVVQSTRDGAERAFAHDIRLNMSHLAWSPDGSMLALRGLMDGLPPEGVFGIHLIDPLDGTVVQTLKRFQPPEQFVEDQIGDLAWTDETTIVFSHSSGIRAFNVATGEDYPVWTAPPGQWVQSLTLSPDRLWLGLTVSDAEMPSWTSTVIIPASGGGVPPRELLRSTAEALTLVSSWTADGQALLALRVDSTRPRTSWTWQLWRIPVDGSPPEPLPIEQPSLSEVRAHPDGHQITFTAGGQGRRNEFRITTGLGQ